MTFQGARDILKEEVEKEGMECVWEQNHDIAPDGSWSWTVLDFYILVRIAVCLFGITLWKRGVRVADITENDEPWFKREKEDPKLEIEMRNSEDALPYITALTKAINRARARSNGAIVLA